ncbi:MAG TPA: succinyl-diaminopimelate desuccinylase [Acidimicrobiales bacterium]|nr:succinyl-diaminopimelate desuccinylase [Acidimicrobiales bacterium]
MRSDLLAATAELVDIPSVSRHESALADHVAAALAGCAWLRIERLGDNVVASTSLGRERRIVVAGHLDTVPPNGNEAARVEGETLWGIGSADMKGGLAVMLDLARSLEAPTSDVSWCFYAREEVNRAEGGLLEIFDQRPDWLSGDAAILCEPTNGVVEAGCQGTTRAVVHMGGVRAHSARPWTGRNAIHRLAPVLDRVAAWSGRVVVLDGCEYKEQLQAVDVSGGVAGNVVPDAAQITLNHRFAPDRDTKAVRQFFHGLLDDVMDQEKGDRIEFVDEGNGAPPGLGHPVLANLLAASGAPARAKLGWTDVATFYARGIPAANFGPGDPLLAHGPDEHVERAALERVRDTLASVLSS